MTAPLAPDMSAPDLSDERFDAVAWALIDYYARLAIIEAELEQRAARDALDLARAVLGGAM